MTYATKERTTEIAQAIANSGILLNPTIFERPNSRNVEVSGGWKTRAPYAIRVEVEPVKTGDFQIKATVESYFGLHVKHGGHITTYVFSDDPVEFIKATKKLVSLLGNTADFTYLAPKSLSDDELITWTTNHAFRPVLNHSAADAKRHLVHNGFIK